MNATVELINKYRDKIINEMVEADEAVYKCSGRIERQIYIYEDGEIEVLDDVSGSNTWLENQYRTLYYICTREAPCFDVYDYSSDTPLRQLEIFDSERFQELKDKYMETLEDEDDFDDYDCREYIRDNSMLEEDYFEYVIKEIISETDYESQLDYIIEELERYETM